MKRLINAGFGETIAHELPTLVELGVEGIRTDCQHQTPEVTAVRAKEITDVGLMPLIVVATLEQLALLPAGTDVELRNEPDLEGPKAKDYATLVEQFAPECETRGLTLWAGVVSNFNKRGFGYLKDAGVQRWPASVNVSIHFYPHKSSPNDPHPGFKSREHEMETFKELICARRWAVSEFGYDMRRPTAADSIAWEFAFYETHGAEFAALYQHLDGASGNVIDHYGIKNIDGSYKPFAAQLFTRTT